MCRSKAEGGRRCACELDRDEANARRRAAYAAARAEAGGTTSFGLPAVPPPSPAAPYMPWDQTRARVTEISEQLEGMDSIEAWGQRNPDGTFTPTREGQRGSAYCVRQEGW